MMLVAPSTHMPDIEGRLPSRPGVTIGSCLDIYFSVKVVTATIDQISVCCQFPLSQPMSFCLKYMRLYIGTV